MRTYGLATGDYVADQLAGGLLRVHNGATLWFWDAYTGGRQVTALNPLPGLGIKNNDGTITMPGDSAPIAVQVDDSYAGELFASAAVDGSRVRLTPPAGGAGGGGGTVDLSGYATTQALSSSLATKADLVGGKIPSSQLPNLSLVDKVVAGSDQEMLALAPFQVQPGDLCVRSDIGTTFLLLANPPSDPANWQALDATATGAVTSVNGHAGPSVALAKADVGLGNVDNTADRDKPVSAAQAAAIAASSPIGLDTDGTPFFSPAGIDPQKQPGYVASTAINQIVSLTGAAYAALAVKDPATLYIVTGATGTGSTGGGGGTTTPPAPTGPIKAAAFTDTFDSLNPSVWAATGTVTVTNGFLDITPALSADASAYAAYATTGTYDLTSSSLAIGIEQLPTGGDSMNLEAYFGTSAGSDSLGFVWEAGALYFRRYNGTTKTAVGSVGFDWPTMQLWRLRHDGTTVFWETSGDGATWAPRAQVAASTLTWAATAGHVILRAGYYDSAQTPSAHGRFRGVNA